ncbi:hypothetical protein R1sor_007121 [Riccia sorocarpa]|uniref:J domain-containing protein n=1 Tax=Riccia sorocarpa TaxID=122646 RepID=A0ABD3HTR4_9MARC
MASVGFAQSINAIGNLRLPVGPAACFPSQNGSVVGSVLPSLSHISTSAEFNSIRRKKGPSKLNPGPLLRSRGDATELSSSLRRGVFICEAHASRRTEVEDYGYDLYELLGVQKDTTVQEIKSAYRWLQKRCHPDIAGRAGHDMSILLNDAYSILADPVRRAAYDAACEDRAEFAGYTGQPLYSRWYGPPGEDRAVFVEETRCVGCLKCALIAPNTFAIENKHGRARAVGQWADDESTIKDAIKACPVDCILWVDRAKLPALEFIMSKQPRLPVGIDSYSYVGVRMENVFTGAEKFLKKYAEREEKLASVVTEETIAQREARMAAAEAIHTRAGRWWHHFIDNQAFTKSGFATGTFASLWDPASTRVAQGALIPLSSVRAHGVRQDEMKVSNNTSHFQDSDVQRLLEVAKRLRRSGGKNFTDSDGLGEEEDYWTPMEPISCPLPPYSRLPEREIEPSEDEDRLAIDPGRFTSPKLTVEENLHRGIRNILKSMPVMVSAAAAVFVGMTGGTQVARSETDLISGPLPASVTSGVFMQVFLAAAVWYMIGAAVCEATIFLSAYFISFCRKAVLSIPASRSGSGFSLELFVARAVVLLEARIWAARIANLRPDSLVHNVRKGFLIFAMAESAMASAESKEVITLKEAKVWLQSKNAGASRVVRARLSRIGLRGKATYVGCPICAKLIYARDRCVHDISSPKSFYRLKAILEDDTGELEATAWEATRCFTGMPLEEYVAKEMREEESEILDRCIGSTWIVRLGRAENHGVIMPG